MPHAVFFVLQGGCAILPKVSQIWAVLFIVGVPCLGLLAFPPRIVHSPDEGRAPWFLATMTEALYCLPRDT